MGAGRPEVTLSAVKSLASSGAFEKLTENLKGSIFVGIRFLKTAGNLYVGGFWGEKSRDANGFSI